MRKIIIFVTTIVLLTQAVSVLAQGGVSGGSNIGDDTFVITCDTGEEIIGGVKFTFININPGTNYRVTAIGIGEFDPIIAVATGPGEGNCNDDESRAANSEVAVPGFGLLTGNNRTAQVQVTAPRGGNVDVLVGGFEGATGQFAMVVEGLAINPRDELDGFLLSVPSVVQNEEIGVYMVSRTTSLNSYMMLGGGPGIQQAELDFNNATTLAECDDVAVGVCSSVPDFPGGGVSITNGGRYVAGQTDAGIVFTPESTDKFIYLFGSSNNQSSGDYAIIVTGTVPGSLTDSTTNTTTTTTNTNTANTGNVPADCTNVATLAVASSEYDASYAAANLLDGNPTTSWSSQTMENQFIMVFFDGAQTVNRILFNSYSASAGFETDSVRGFEIATVNPTNNKVTTLSLVEADLVQGYQEYTFAPVTSDNIVLYLQSNHGGTTFEAADILVCAQ